MDKSGLTKMYNVQKAKLRERKLIYGSERLFTSR